MRPGGVGTEGDNRLEADLGALSAHLQVEDAGQFALRDSRPDVTHGPLERRRGDGGGGPDRGQLALVLDAPQVLDESVHEP